MRAVLMYHSIDDSGSPISITESDFERHLAWLSSGAVSVVPFSEIASTPADEHAVALTFDDAFTSFADFAWPRLKDRGLPASVFVVSDHVGGNNQWGGRADPGIPSLALSGWEDLARVAEEGAELGCHSRTHPDLTRLTRAQVEEELVGSRAQIQAETGVLASSFAYPFGYHGPDARELAREHFEQSCTTSLDILPPAPPAHLQPRLDAWYYRGASGASRLAAWNSLRFHAHLRFRAGARRLRAAFRPLGPRF